MHADCASLKYLLIKNEYIPKLENETEDVYVDDVTHLHQAAVGGT